MDIISSQLSLSDIKNLRQVNSSLNEMMLSYLIKRNFTLIIPTTSSSLKEIQQIDASILKLDPNFVKKVQLNIGSAIKKIKKNKKNTQEDLTSIIEFFKVHQSCIENLEIVAGSRFAPILTQILISFQFPSLTHFSITEAGDLFLRSSSHSINLSNLNLKEKFLPSEQFQKLISIKFHVDNESCLRNLYVRAGPDFRILIQNFMDEVNVTRNLEELEIKDDNFIPDVRDVSGLKKLKIIAISDTNCFHSSPNFHIGMLYMMLSQAQTTLEELTLDVVGLSSNGHLFNLHSLNLPNLKILKIYSLESFYGWSLYPEYQTPPLPNPEQCPNLTSLVLGVHSESYNTRLYNFLTSSTIPFQSVKELEFIGDTDFRLLTRAQFLFPNVKSFTVQPNLIWNDYNFSTFLTTICVNVWKLQNLTVVQSTRNYKLLDWIHQIVFGGSCLRCYYSALIPRTFLQTSTLDKFIIQVEQGVRIPSGVKEVLMKFSKENNLPIYIHQK